MGVAKGPIFRNQEDSSQVTKLAMVVPLELVRERRKKIIKGKRKMKRILIVDKYHFSRDFLAEELAESGYVVATSAHPASIKEMLSGFDPDLVIMDLDFQGEDRWDIFLEIKTRNPEMPVIFFTGNTSYLRDPRMSLADGYVKKNIDITELQGKIEDFVDKRKGAKGNLNNEKT